MSTKHMRLISSIVITGCLIAGCSDRSSSAAESADASGFAAGVSTASKNTASPDDRSSTAKQASSSNASAGGALAPAIAGRTGELVNPDEHAMLFLYFDLAGIKPPLDQWVDQDYRVTSAAAFDKAAVRAAVKAELEAAAAAVRGVGFIRVSMNANISDYDPTYGEFSVRALAPSSTLGYKARSHQVSIRFANGRVAQIWRVPPDQAQVIRDKIGSYGNASLDALLRITSVQPSHAGGTITTEVIEYEMRETRRGLTIGRVRVAG